MAKFVTRPHVALISQSTIDTDALEQWAEDQGLVEIYDDVATPLGRIATATHKDDHNDILSEFAARFCYRSWEAGRESKEYIENIIESRHGSVLRHGSVGFAISGVSRSLSHELVRHGAGCAPSQESQRYVAANDIRFVVPPLITRLSSATTLAKFTNGCTIALDLYRETLSDLEKRIAERNLPGSKTTLAKRAREAARSLLPNAAETRIFWTMNMQAARFVCEQRSSEHADLETRALACEFIRIMKIHAPLIFADFELYIAEDGMEAGRCLHSKV